MLLNMACSDFEKYRTDFKKAFDKAWKKQEKYLAAYCRDMYQRCLTDFEKGTVKTEAAFPKDEKN